MNLMYDITKKKNAFSFTFLAKSLEVKDILLERERERERAYIKHFTLFADANRDNHITSHLGPTPVATTGRRPFFRIAVGNTSSKVKHYE
jgi:hypothetical protein